MLSSLLEVAVIAVPVVGFLNRRKLWGPATTGTYSPPTSPSGRRSPSPSWWTATPTATVAALTTRVRP